ncbi:MAG: hypothetical protein HOE45_07290 [Gammaproteobacteria bacterium]|jgi:hypothetical protein|nr:hypothetical protein [Gammaproteobacteria bacterium]MBT6574645.1 hypothetical protein [Gammaproteobacteria bacterium]
MRVQFHDLIGDYLGLIATNTFPARNPEWQTIPQNGKKNPNNFFDTIG